MQRKKHSFGIACCRLNPETTRPEVLMVQKKTTYSFFNFVFNKYNYKDIRKMSQLFNTMTKPEKQDILKFDFEKLWNRIGIDCEPQVYQKKKTKFDNLNKEFITNLIKRSSNADPIWEIPKGRMEHEELPLNTAIRELYEETNVDRELYRVYADAKPILYTNCTDYMIYQTTYFLGEIIDSKYEPCISFDNHFQMSEIDNIKWVSLSEFYYMNRGHQTKQMRNLIARVLFSYRKFRRQPDILIYHELAAVPEDVSPVQLNMEKELEGQKELNSCLPRAECLSDNLVNIAIGQSA